MFSVLHTCVYVKKCVHIEQLKEISRSVMPTHEGVASCSYLATVLHACTFDQVRQTSEEHPSF